MRAIAEMRAAEGPMKHQLWQSEGEDVADEKDWIDIFSALLTPAIALFALYLGFQNFRLARRRRHDELFDKRYAFYERVRAIWLSSGAGADEGEDPSLDIEYLLPIAEEAEFLFGKDIAEHILSLEGPGHPGSPFFPNEDFIAPFRKYLALEK